MRLSYQEQLAFRATVYQADAWNGLFNQNIDVEWVENFEQNAPCAEQMEAFVSRFGRMQDTMADKLLPRWLLSLAETPGSQIETLNRAERLGVLASTDRWLEMRNLRNRLVHEYMTDPAKFAQDLMLAKEDSLMLIETYNRLRKDATTRMGAAVYLFGSRLNDQAKGGDIDLFIESDTQLSLIQRAQIKMELESQLGLPVDIVSNSRDAKATPFQVIAQSQSTQLEM